MIAPTRHLYLARHGAADAFGELSEVGREQSRLLGERLSRLPLDTLWHSPLPRAEASAREVARHLPDVPVRAAPELTDHVPFVPDLAHVPASWRGFFDGYDDVEAKAGRAVADALVARFATPAGPGGDVHEAVVTHDYPIAWLVRHALGSPEHRWIGLNSANAALTVIQYRAGLPPTLILFNESSHLRPDLRWTGFPAAVRP